MSQRTDLNAAHRLEAPRFADGWAALAFAIATLLLAYPALAGGFLVSPHSDQYIAGYAFREFAAASLRAGEGFPQWNSYLFGGMPYIAAMHGDIFYPTFLLRMLLPTDVAMTWGFIIHLFLAGYFTYAFLRAWGVGFYASVVGGLAYMLSGPIAGYASPGHDGKLFVSTLLPLTLWMLVRAIRDNRTWSWGVLALTIGLAVLSPHPQLLQYMLLASGAFALFLALSPDAAGNTLPRSVALKRLGLAFGAVVLGFAMGAIQYLPVREYVDWSPRAGGKGYDHAVSYSLPTEELINAIVPQFSGILDNYWGRNGIHFHSEYAGVVVLVLAGAGMFAATARRGFRWFWLGTLIVSLLWALGGSTPFYHIIYAVVPGTKFFRAPSTMMYVTMFSLAVFAALGTERVLASAAPLAKQYFIGWAVAVVGIGLLIAAGVSMTIAQGIGAAVAPTLPQYPADAVIASYVDRAGNNQPHALVGSLRSIVFAFLTLGVLWASARRRISARGTAFALATLVAVDLWSIERHYWIFSPRAATIFAPDAAIERMRSDSAPGRVLAFTPRGSPEEGDPAFRGDVFMTHRIRSARGYHGNQLGRYDQLLEATNQGLQPGFWRHANVRYFYTTLPDSAIPQGFTKLAGPVRNAFGSMVNLYRVPGDGAAAWVASAMVKGNDDQALATVVDPRFDPTRAAILDSAAEVQVADLTTAPAPAGVQATVTRFASGGIDIHLDKPAPAGSALVVSENFYPGWRGTADGRQALVTRANFNLIGVVLPAGARDVQLRFTDPGYAVGKTITLIAVLGALAAIAAGIIMDRRRPSSRPDA